MEIAVHEDVPRIFVVRADCLPQLEADWMVVQPDVVQADPMWGWERVGEIGLYIGNESLCRIKLRPEDPETLCRVSGADADSVKIENCSDEFLRLVAHHRRTGGSPRGE